MMRVSAQVQCEPGEEQNKRAAERRASNTMATVRQLKQPNHAIHIVDISPEGCGFRSRWPIAAGTHIWLGLPGLETWAARVVWFEDGKGGLHFERPLHPLVAERFAKAEPGRL
jgi:hypothetical protein